MYKVYINELLIKLTQHSCALSLNSISLTSPAFADDITLLSIYHTFLSTFMNMCYEYSIKWHYEFNHLKSGIVTFGETKCVQSEAMKVHNWTLGSKSVSELYEYKNLGVVKNYFGSFSTNADKNIEKTFRKAGMIFSSNFDRRKVSPLIYINSGGKHVFPLYFTALNYLLLHLHYKLSLSVVSSGSLKMFSMFQSLHLDNCS